MYVEKQSAFTTSKLMGVYFNGLFKYMPTVLKYTTYVLNSFYLGMPWSLRQRKTGS